MNSDNAIELIELRKQNQELKDAYNFLKVSYNNSAKFNSEYIKVLELKKDLKNILERLNTCKSLSDVQLITLHELNKINLNDN